MIFAACIMLTYYYTKETLQCEKNVEYRFVPRTYQMDYNNWPIPSKVFQDMFDLPSTWMGQAEKDSREAQTILIKQREDMFNKEKLRIERDRKKDEVQDILTNIEKFGNTNDGTYPIFQDLEKKKLIRSKMYEMTLTNPYSFNDPIAYNAKVVDYVYPATRYGDSDNKKSLFN